MPVLKDNRAAKLQSVLMLRQKFPLYCSFQRLHSKPWKSKRLKDGNGD